jgi:hypothetical protein
MSTFTFGWIGMKIESMAAIMVGRISFSSIHYRRHLKVLNLQRNSSYDFYLKR